MDRHNDRRKSERFRLNQLIDVGFGREDFVYAEGRDISATGIGCETTHPVDPSTHMYMMFQVGPQHDRTTIQCEGVVTRCTSVDHDKYDIGIEFTEMQDRDRVTLIAYLAAQ